MLQSHDASSSNYFGPIALPGIVDFCDTVDQKLAHLSPRNVIFCMPSDPHNFTNAIFLLCCYLVLRVGMSAEEALIKFIEVDGLPEKVCQFRDASHDKECLYGLSVSDCVGGLLRAIERGILDETKFDVKAFEMLYSRDNLGLTIVTPKFVAMSCPGTSASAAASVAAACVGRVGGHIARAARVDDLVNRPENYFAALKNLGVTDIVRVNAQETYDAEEFKREGFKFHDLPHAQEGCGSCPCAENVQRFLDVANAAEGRRIAVHCLSGLGQTGTLIACDLIKNHGFTAPQAIGYMRLVRPGSVMSEQQEFLHLIEMCSWDGNLPIAPLGEIKKDGILSDLATRTKLDAPVRTNPRHLHLPPRIHAFSAKKCKNGFVATPVKEEGAVNLGKAPNTAPDAKLGPIDEEGLESHAVEPPRGKIGRMSAGPSLSHCAAITDTPRGAGVHSRPHKCREEVTRIFPGETVSISKITSIVFSELQVTLHKAPRVSRSIGECRQQKTRAIGMTGYSAACLPPLGGLREEAEQYNEV